MNSLRLLLLGALVPSMIACGRSSPVEKAAAQPTTPPLNQQSAASAISVSAKPAASVAAPKLNFDAYPWLSDPTIRSPSPVDHLVNRLSPPPGFTRVALDSGSFGAWLRNIPLTKADEPVRSYLGNVLLPYDHPNIAAVVAIDIGNADLQQCADAVMRMHAEWLWSQGIRNMSYQAASGTPMPFERWAKGDRPVGKGASLVWEAKGKSGGDHGSFRKFMDSVFMFANTVALARQAKPTPLDSIRPGDFVVQGGNPGHAVLVLDMATSSAGDKVLLLGQSYMPAQSFQVLRPNAHSLWFAVNPSDGLKTPFWPKFQWEMLRRLD